MKNHGINKRGLYLILFTTFIPSLCAAADVSYLYSLSNFSGTLPFDYVKVSIDEIKNEVYVIEGENIRVFNPSGMEIYNINAYDLGLGTVYDLAVNKDGNLIILSYKSNRYSISVANYRGEPLSTLEIRGLPKDFEDFSPNGMILKDDLLYLYSSGSMRVVVIGLNGDVKDSYDLSKIAEINSDDIGMGQMSIDRDGNILFTAPVIAKAFILSPEKKLRLFGRRGSAPGRFGIPYGIVRDREGNLYVSDKLRSCVLIFDKELKFIKEFGYRGFRPENLIVPEGLSIDERGRLYVTQRRKRGVSVFKIANASN